MIDDQSRHTKKMIDDTVNNGKYAVIKRIDRLYAIRLKNELDYNPVTYFLSNNGEWVESIGSLYTWGYLHCEFVCYIDDIESMFEDGEVFNE